MINDKLFKGRWQQIKQQEQHAKKQVEYLQALNVFKRLLQSVHLLLETWALDDPEQCGAKVKANKSWILCLLQEGSGRRGRATKVNCQSSLAKGTRQLNGLENVSYVSLPLDSISVRPFREATKEGVPNVYAIQFFKQRGTFYGCVCVCACALVCAFALRAFLVLFIKFRPRIFVLYSNSCQAFACHKMCVRGKCVLQVCMAYACVCVCVSVCMCVMQLLSCMHF